MKAQLEALISRRNRAWRAYCRAVRRNRGVWAERAWAIHQRAVQSYQALAICALGVTS